MEWVCHLLRGRRANAGAGGEAGACDQHIDGRFRPARHRHGPDAAAFADQVHDDSAAVALLDMSSLSRGLLAAQAAAEHDGEQRAVIAFPLSVWVPDVVSGSALSCRTVNRVQTVGIIAYVARGASAVMGVLIALCGNRVNVDPPNPHRRCGLSIELPFGCCRIARERNPVSDIDGDLVVHLHIGADGLLLGRCG